MKTTYAFKQLFHQKKFVLLFSLTLSLGLTGFISVYHLKFALMNTISSRAKAMMGGDLKISSRQPFSSEELKTIDDLIPRTHRLSQSVSLFSMLRDAQGQSRLVQVRAIDASYPLYGDIEREKLDGSAPHDTDRWESNASMWLHPELRSQIQITPDEKVFLGQSSFWPTDIVTKDQANFSDGFAPRVYITLEALDATGLMTTGSLFWVERLYAFETVSLEDIKRLRKTLRESLDRPGVKVESFVSANRQTNRMIDYLSDFLGLVALAAFMLSGLGSYFLIRTYFQSQYRSIGTLMSLGLRPLSALSIYFIQTLALSTFSALLAVTIAQLFLPLLLSSLDNISSADIPLRLSLETMGIAWLLAVAQCFFIAGPILLSLKQLPLRTWLDQDAEKVKTRFAQALVSYAPLALFYTIIAVWISKSLLTGGLFVGMLAICLVLSLILFRGLSQFLQRFSQSKDIALYLALINIRRKPLSHALIFVSLSLALSLIQAIPQIEKSLSQNLSEGKARRLPSLFLFDIQDDQISELKNLIEESGHSFTKILPMVRARLSQLNGQVFTKGETEENLSSREAERERQFRNRGFNLTYQRQLSESERLHAGRTFSGVYDGDGPAEVSVERRFARRLGFKLGDRLQFTVQGISIDGKIVNFKTVDWTSFEPNFFVSFQEGVLENAPKTFLASLAQMPTEDKNALQNTLAKRFPNVSIIDIERLARELQKILVDMAYALSLMSFLSLIVGGVVIFSIIRHQGTQHAWELALKKVLGMRRFDIQRQYLYQFGILVLFAVFISLLLSIGLSLVLSRYLFESPWIVDWRYPLWSYPLLTLLILGTIVAATHQYFNIRAAVLLGTKR